MGARPELRRIAELAQLRLTDRELAAIADYIDDAVGRLPPSAGPAESPPPGPRRPSHGRADEPGTLPLAEPLDAMAPAWRDGFFTVPAPGRDA